MHTASINLLLALAIAFFSTEGCTAKPAPNAAVFVMLALNHRRTHNYQTPASDNCANCGSLDVLPERFFGNFTLNHSENFDEYLTAKGYKWFSRKWFTLSTVEKVFARTKNPKTFDYSNLTSKKEVYYKNVFLGKPFTGEELDSTKHEITFTLKNGHLFEHHKLLKKGKAKEEIYEYYFDGGWLLQKMSSNGIECRRYYKKTK